MARLAVAGAPATARRSDIHEQAAPVRALTSALLTASSGALPLMLAGTLVVQITDELKINEATFGAGIGSFFLASALASTRSGRFADRVGWQRSALFASGLSLLSLLGVATLAHSFPVLVGFIALGGVAQSIAMPATNLTLMREMPSGRQGLAFGVKQTSNPVSGLLAGLAVPAIALTVGWRWAFALGVVIPLAAIALTPSVSWQGLGAGPVPRRIAPPHGIDLRPVVVIAIGGALATFAVISVSSFVVASAVRSGVAVGTAGVFVALASTSGLAVRVLGGWAADRWSSRGLLPTASLLALGSVGFALLATQRAGLVLPGMIVTYAAGWGWPGLFHFGISAYHPHAPASATGIVQVGVTLGGAVGPVLSGWIVSRAGYDAVWLLSAGMVLVASGCVVAAARMMERRAEPVTAPAAWRAG